MILRNLCHHLMLPTLRHQHISTTIQTVSQTRVTAMTTMGTKQQFGLPSDLPMPKLQDQCRRRHPSDQQLHLLLRRRTHRLARQANHRHQNHPRKCLPYSQISLRTMNLDPCSRNYLLKHQAYHLHHNEGHARLLLHLVSLCLEKERHQRHHLLWHKARALSEKPQQPSRTTNLQPERAGAALNQ